MNYTKSQDTEALAQAVELENRLQFSAAKQCYRDLLKQDTISPYLRARALINLSEIHILFSEQEACIKLLKELEELPLSNVMQVEHLLLKVIEGHKELRDQLESLERAMQICEQFPEECGQFVCKVLRLKSERVSESERPNILNQALQAARKWSMPEQQIYILLQLTVGKSPNEVEQLLAEAKQLIHDNYEFPAFLLVIYHSRKAAWCLDQLRYEEAIQCSQKIEQSYRQKQVELPIIFLQYALSYCGYANNKIGDHFEALFYSQKALMLAKKLNSGGLTYSCCVLAQIYRDIGKTDLAIKYAEEAFDYFKQFYPSWRENPAGSELEAVYMTLAYSYETVDKQTALDYYQSALQYLEETEEDPTKARNYAFVKERSILLLPPEEGLKVLEAALPILPNTYQLYDTMAGAFLEKGELNASLSYFSKSLDSNLMGDAEFDIEQASEKQQFHNDIQAFEVLLNMGQVCFRLYQQDKQDFRLQQSLAYYQFALILQGLLRQSVDSQSQIVHNDQLPESFSYFMKGILHSPEPDYGLILRLFESCKSNVLQQSMSAKQLQAQYKRFPFYEKERQLQIKIRQLETAWNQATEEVKKNNLFQQLFDKRQEHQRLIRSLEEEYPDYFNSRFAAETSDIEKVKGLLNEEEKVLNYLLLDDQILILFISEQETELVFVPLPDQFVKDLSKYLSSIKSIDSASVWALAPKLYQYLIAPVEDLLFDIFANNERCNLTIIPHKQLAAIPFEALFKSAVGEEVDYLISHFDIAYHYSIGLWIKSREKDAPMQLQGFLGLAPVYDDISTENAEDAIYWRNEQAEDWAALPYTKKEVEMIRELFEREEKASLLLMNQNASKAELLQQIARFRYVHIAAHFHQDEIPQRSGLVLSEGNYLFVDETYSLDLTTELVVLSACESGIGELSNSEGMMAISRGLLYAGAHNVVTTLFKINDLLAYELMLLFYQELLKGTSIRAALNSAKRSFSRRPEVTEKVWAAFTLIGK